MLTKLPVPYDFCVGVPISRLLVGTFNQEKALVGAFSVIGKTDCETDGALHSTSVHMSTVHWRCKVTVCLVSLCPGWSQFANSTNYISNKFGSAQPRYLITNTTTGEIRRALLFLWDFIPLHHGY